VRIDRNVAVHPCAGSVHGSELLMYAPLEPYANASPVHCACDGVLSSR
jgi:hypothetical protein